MRPVNLIPPEQRRGGKAPLRTGVLGYVIVAIMAVALAGVTAVVLTGNQITDRKAEVSTLQSQVTQAQARAEQLSRYEQFASLQQARQDTVSSLAKSRFDWERVLRELALVMPSDVWLTGLTASASGDSSSGSSSSSSSSDTSSIQGPSIDMHGCASSHDAVASFLASLRDIDGVTRATVMSSDAQDDSGASTSSTGSSASSNAGSGSGTCSSRGLVVSFEIIIAFDGASPTAESAPPSSSPESAPTSTTSSQVSDGVQQLNQQADSAKQQTDKAQKAAGTANTLIPGTGSTP
jgi:Tfp pilus assembly protein PilN